ncbi:hypothetical protein PIB30_070739 [Stylosanthes scabra]|uniref:TF-B3 domain-containing protein n=1 Tax=Stylosanthes scabra TaxID=79078 RepID=A0ABU6ZM90_9FABA|nr:hypothetical protein [Stylosanthes scabra]
MLIVISILSSSIKQSAVTFFPPYTSCEGNSTETASENVEASQSIPANSSHFSARSRAPLTEIQQGYIELTRSGTSSLSCVQTLTPLSTIKEVVGHVDKNLYVRDIVPYSILELISKDFKLSYLDGPSNPNSAVSSPSNKSLEIQRKTPLTLKRNIGSSSASTLKKRHTANKATGTRTSEVMTISKTMNSTDIKATRLYVPVEFTKTMAKAGVKETWYVIAPPIEGLVRSFIFQLLPSCGRETELKIGGDWQKFCLAYDLQEGTSVTMKIKSIEERTIQITIITP